MIGSIRLPSGGPLSTVELPDAATVTDLLSSCGYSELERRGLRVARNNTVLPPASELCDGDELVLFSQLGGG